MPWPIHKQSQISADGAHVSTAGPWLTITDILTSAANSQYNMYQRLLEYKQEYVNEWLYEYKILLWSKTMLSVKTFVRW